MTIDNTGFLGDYHYGLYNNKPAYKDIYKKIIYVFKDISAKRINTRNNFNSESKWYKIMFVTNKQLLSMDYLNEIKDCVFDGKLGTRYSTRSSSGSYHWCLRQGGQIPVARKPH
jgi:hypothetical protein